MSIQSLAIEGYYGLGLRRRFNDNQRLLVEKDAPRAPLPHFNTPQEIEDYIRPKFDWRKDQLSGRLGKGFIPLDWVSHQEVFQYRLQTGSRRDGDCDDYHFWFSHCLLRIPSVEQVYMLSSGFKGRKGHTTCVFKQGGQWYHVDYRIRKIQDPNDAPRLVAIRYADGNDKVPWYVWETPYFEFVASGPGKRGRLP